MPVVEREETRARTELGAAQKDTARDLAAKLSSLKGIVWVGVGLFIFGLASLVYPPLKVIVASVTTSLALMLGGVALIVLPTMVVGNELLILGVVALVVGAWFLAHRHGQLKGSLESQVQSLKPGASGQSSAKGAVTSNQ
jgi:membrane-bound ClpP family serine protease